MSMVYSRSFAYLESNILGSYENPGNSNVEIPAKNPVSKTRALSSFILGQNYYIILLLPHTVKPLI